MNQNQMHAHAEWKKAMWRLIVVSSIVTGTFGFFLGWFSGRAYLRHEMEKAITEAFMQYGRDLGARDK